MASHFSSIGFPVTSEEDFHAVVHRAKKSGKRHASRQGLYVLWAPGNSIELWVQVHRQAGLGINPHYSGQGRMKVRVESIMPSQSSPLDGSIKGWAAPDPGDTNSGAFPFVFDLPNFDLVHRDLRQGSIIDVQLAAFAHELTCYADDTAFDAAQSEPKLASESFFPVGLFTDDQEGSGPSAMAVFAGHILQAEVRENPATGHSFHHLVVQTLGGTADVVADPTCVEGEPVIGGVVRGAFWLSGRIVQEDAPRPGILRRLFGIGR